MTVFHQITSAGMTVAFSAILLVTSHQFLEARSAKSALMASKLPVSVSKASTSSLRQLQNASRSLTDDHKSWSGNRK